MGRRATEWSIERARVCAEAARAVYQRCELNTELAHATVLDFGSARVLAFRGSACVRDWVTDFDCDLVSSPGLDVSRGVKVHDGFWQAWSSIDDLVRRSVCGWTRPPVLITGHSLGGAIALLAAWALALRGYSPDGVYTFGGPRVGNAAFARLYNRTVCGLSNLGQRTFRLVNEEDIVPRVPGYLMGYRHVGNEVFLSSIGSWYAYRVNPSIWSKLISDVVGTYRDWKLGRVAQLRDHAIDRYVSRLGGQTATGKTEDRGLRAEDRSWQTATMKTEDRSWQTATVETEDSKEVKC